MNNTNAPVKVLMFGWEFPPYISGGLGTACFGLTRSMVEQGAQVTFVVPRAEHGKNTSTVNLIGGNHVLPLDNDERSERIQMSEEYFKMVKVDAYLRPYQNADDYYQAIRELKESSREELLHAYDNSIIDISGNYGPDLMSEVARYGKLGTRLAMREEFDVIHAHDWMCFAAGVEAKRQSGKPLICHVHATEFDRSGEHPNPDVYQLERYGMDNADRVITVSHRTKDVVHRHYGVPLEKIRVVHNGVIEDTSVKKGEVDHAYTDKLVLFLGRITMQKGPEYFVEAAAQVLRAIPNVRFVMAGSGDMLPDMIEKIAELRLQKHFHFTGFLRGKNTEKMFAMSDLFIMPSVSEPFGITPIEAMKYHVPTIISKQSGIAEVLENTIKVDFWDVDHLARAIIDVLTDGHTSDSLTTAGIKEVATITWDKAAEKVLDCYSEVITA